VPLADRSDANLGFEHAILILVAGRPSMASTYQFDSEAVATISAETRN